MNKKKGGHTNQPTKDCGTGHQHLYPNTTAHTHTLHLTETKPQKRALNASEKTKEANNTTTLSSRLEEGMERETKAPAPVTGFVRGPGPPREENTGQN